MVHDAPFVTLHGIDGTGKSTTIAMVCAVLCRDGYTCINYDSYKETMLNNPFSVAKQNDLLLSHARVVSNP